MAVEFQYLLAPMALVMEATQSGPSLVVAGWSEWARVGTIQVTWASWPSLMSVRTLVSGEMTLVAQSEPKRMWRMAWKAERMKKPSPLLGA